DSSARVAANFRVPRVAVVGVRRASTATFYSRNTNTTGFAEGSIVLGNTTEDIGLWGDWTGIGTYTPGVYRPRDGTFHLSTVPGSRTCGTGTRRGSRTSSSTTGSQGTR